MATPIVAGFARYGSARIIIATAAVSLLIGALTALGQQYLSDAWRPVANSSGSWTLLAFVMAAFARNRVTAATVGALTFVGLLAGYAIASELRGYAIGAAMMMFWLAASVTVGPVIGLGAALVRRAEDRLASFGAGLMGGVLVGEGIFGLTLVADTTEPHWWVTSIIIGVVVVLAVPTLRRSDAVAWIISIGTTATLATALWLVYQFNPMALVT